jgi:hypothetical protein
LQHRRANDNEKIDHDDNGRVNFRAIDIAQSSGLEKADQTFVKEAHPNVMKHKSHLSHKASALLIVFSLLQVYAVLALAGPSLSTDAGVPPLPIPPQAITGRLTTRGNQPILVNGNSVHTGATILTGSTIETGDQVGATINFGSLGSIDIAPNTKVQVEFSDGQLKVTILQGCAIVRNNKGTSAQVYTLQGLATSNDPNQKQAAVLDVCLPAGAPSPIINQGAAANAGAGAAVAGAGGLSKVVLFSILGGVGEGTALAFAFRGRNPSPIR